jgi:hypothetical protein
MNSHCCDMILILVLYCHTKRARAGRDIYKGSGKGIHECY